MSLPAKRIVSVTVNLTPTGVPNANFSTLMIFGSTQGVVNATERFRSYSQLSVVEGDFGTNAPEAKAASLYFGQVPQPSSLKIGYWAAQNTCGALLGGLLTPQQQEASNFTGITNGGCLAIVNGNPYAINGMNFSAVANMSQVAAVLGAGLLADVPTIGASMVSAFDVDNESILVNFDIVGLDTVSFFAPPTGVGSVTFGSNPGNTQTLTINGFAIEFVSASPTGQEVLIGGTTQVTLANLLTFLEAQANPEITASLYTISSAAGMLFVQAAAPGPSGDSITLSTTVSGAVLSGSTLMGGTGTDVSAPLLLGSGQGGKVIPALAAEDPLTAFTIIEGMTSFYGCQFASSFMTDSYRLEIAAYVEGDAVQHVFGITTGEVAALTTGDSSSIGFFLKQLGYNRTFYQYSSTNIHAVASIFGRMLTVNFQLSNSVLIVMFGSEPGVAPENLTEAQADALDANHYNYYASFSNQAVIIVNGWMASGNFFDIIQGTDNLASDIQTAVFNLLSTSRVPQTDAGNTSLATTISGVLQQYVENGFLAPGTYNAPGFGNIVEGQFLSLGYYVFVPSILSQSEAARAKRVSVPIQVAAKGSGAVQSADIAINFNA